MSGNTIKYNSAGRGAGMSAFTFRGSVSNNLMEGNFSNAVLGKGGGLYVEATSPTVTGNTMAGNSARAGGGLALVRTSATVTGNTIAEGNSGTLGGGVYLANSSASLTNNTIAHNLSDRHGGGIYAEQGSSPILTGNTISTNSAVGIGGGLYIAGDSFVELDGDTIVGNSAGRGGGLDVSGNSFVILSNSTVASNSATGADPVRAGGVSVWGGTAILTGNTISDSIGYGIDVRGVSQISIQGDQISGSSKHGIYCANAAGEVAGASIYGNGGDGVAVRGDGRLTVSQCSIYDNGGLGIDLNDDGVTANDEDDLDSGPNDLLNFPEFTTRDVVGNTATFCGVAPAWATVEVFAAALDPTGYGEGMRYVESATADADRNFTLSVSLWDLPVTATATDADGNTSEFSLVPALYAIPVAIDIKPGSDPNAAINNDGNGVIPVAVLGTADFDVSVILVDTVWLQGMSVRAVGKANKLLWHYEDVNGDGFDDLLVQIEDVDGALAEGATMATLTAETLLDD
ncbi:MAG: right-handed parallel beta-helix repeat-containing protein, partial [Armatimonadota bacterium]